MSPITVPAVDIGSLEGVALDGLELNDGTAWMLEAFEVPPPGKRPEWAQGADADGALLVRDPLFENRTVTLRMRLAGGTDMDSSLAQILALSQKLEECEQQPDGLELVWTPADGTTSGTVYVLSGAITEMPITVNGGGDVGWFDLAPVLTVVLTCKPFIYGDEVTLSAVSGSGQYLSLTIPDVPGDVPAEGRLVVTDGASKSRRFIEWGLEQRHYNPTPSLQIHSSVFSLTGYAGTSTTRTGSVNTNIIRGTLYRTPAALGIADTLGHTGTFRVKARVYASNSDVRVRLGWQDSDGPWRANPAAAPPVAGAWSEIDLGIVTISEATMGSQKWAARLEAFVIDNDSLGATVDLDYLLLIPAGEGYGKARGPYTLQAGAVRAVDTFDNATASSALNGRTAIAGGTWATSGATTDWVAVNGFGSSANPIQMARSTNADSGSRRGVLGSTTFTDMAVSASFYWTAGLSVSAGQQVGIIARYVDASNFIYAAVDVGGGGFGIYKNIAGVSTGLETRLGLDPTNGYRIQVICLASGRVIAYLSKSSVVATLETNWTEVATGGTLASGKPGFYDYAPSGTAITRYIDDFLMEVPPAEPIALHSGRTAEIRHDTAIRQNSTGTVYGQMPAYRGSRFLIPPAGDQDRTSRVIVKAHRNDIDAADATNVTDSLSAYVAYRPRFLVVPG